MGNKIIRDRMMCSRAFKIKLKKLAADHNTDLTRLTDNLSKKDIGDLLEDGRTKKPLIPFRF